MPSDLRHRLSNGNDIAALCDVVSPMRSGEQRPLVVILDSIKRYGVAYQENLQNSHHL